MYQTIPGHNELQYYIIFSLMLKLVLILINVCQYIEIKSVGFVFGPLCGLDNEKAEKPWVHTAGPPDSKVDVFCTQERHVPKQVYTLLWCNHVSANMATTASHFKPFISWKACLKRGSRLIVLFPRNVLYVRSLSANPAAPCLIMCKYMFIVGHKPF